MLELRKTTEDIGGERRCNTCTVCTIQGFLVEQSADTFCSTCNFGGSQYRKLSRYAQTMMYAFEDSIRSVYASYLSSEKMDDGVYKTTKLLIQHKKHLPKLECLCLQYGVP